MSDETPLENRKSGVWHENEEDAKNADDTVVHLYLGKYRGAELPAAEPGSGGAGACG